jgi:uncharacterized glyoxalase superfamily protein PhnB
MLSNRSIPNCTVIPELAYPDIGKAIDWLGDAFGFTLRLRIANHRAQLNVGDGALVLTELPEGQQVDGGHSMLVRVESVDRHCEQATRHGAVMLRAPADHPYGERQCTVEDFAGHRWTFSQSIADVDPTTWGGTPGKL